MINDFVIVQISKETLHKLLIERVQLSYKVRKELIKKGLYLKPFHICYKRTKLGEMEYRYYGKYWYRIERRDGKVKLRYVGCNISDAISQAVSFNIEGFSFIAYRYKDSPVFIRNNILNKYKDLLMSMGIIIQ